MRGAGRHGPADGSGHARAPADAADADAADAADAAECPVCLEPVDDPLAPYITGAPRALPCGHPIHHQCAHHMLSISRRFMTRDEAQGAGLCGDDGPGGYERSYFRSRELSHGGIKVAPCPLCRTPFFKGMLFWGTFSAAASRP